MMGKMEIVGATDCSQVTLWFQSKLVCWHLHVSGGVSERVLESRRRSPGLAHAGLRCE